MTKPLSTSKDRAEAKKEKTEAKRRIKVTRFLTVTFLFIAAMLNQASAFSYVIDGEQTFIYGKFVFHVDDETVGEGKAWLVGVRPDVTLEGEITIPGSAVKGDRKWTVTKIGTEFSTNGYPDMWWYYYEPAICDQPGITKITIPSTINEIQDFEFLGCTGITEFHVNSTNRIYKDENGILFRRADWAPYDDENVEYGDYWSLFRMPPATKKTRYTLPTNTHTILNNAFADNKTIKTIVVTGAEFMPLWSNRNRGINTIDVSQSQLYEPVNGVIYYTTKHSIGKYTTIAACPPALTMESLTLPASVKIIEPGAFANTSIDEIVMPDGIEEIYRFAFYGSRIKSLKLNVGFFEYPDYMDYRRGMCLDCKKLETVELTGSASQKLRIPPYMFCGCENLSSLTISSNNIDLGSHAFYSCKKLTSFPFAKIYSWDIGYSDGKEGYQFAYSGLKTARIPSGFGFVPRGMFMGSDLEQVNLNPSGKNTLNHILEDAFRDCKLTEVNLESVKFLDPGCFVGTPLKKVVFPCKSDEDEYSGGDIEIKMCFTPSEDTWFYVGNQRIDWKDTYDWETGEYFASGLEKATYVTSARRGINVPHNFQTVYGPAGIEPGKGTNSSEYVGWAKNGFGDVIPMFDISTVSGKTAMSITQLQEASDLTFKMNSVLFDSESATQSGNIWGIAGTSSPDKYLRTLNYTVNGVELITFYPKDYRADSAVEEIPVDVTDAEIISIHRIDGTSAVCDWESAAPGVYIVRYSDNSVKKLLKR